MGEGPVAGARHGKAAQLRRDIDRNLAGCQHRQRRVAGRDETVVEVARKIETCQTRGVVVAGTSGIAEQHDAPSRSPQAAQAVGGAVIQAMAVVQNPVLIDEERRLIEVTQPLPLHHRHLVHHPERHDLPFASRKAERRTRSADGQGPAPGVYARP